MRECADRVKAVLVRIHSFQRERIISESGLDPKSSAEFFIVFNSKILSPIPTDRVRKYGHLKTWTPSLKQISSALIKSDGLDVPSDQTDFNMIEMKSKVISTASIVSLK